MDLSVSNGSLVARDPEPVNLLVSGAVPRRIGYAVVLLGVVGAVAFAL